MSNPTEREEARKGAGSCSRTEGWRDDADSSKSPARLMSGVERVSLEDGV